MRRERVGSFWVDTTMVIVGDPLQVLQSEDCNKAVPTYNELISKLNQPRQERVDEILSKSLPTQQELEEARTLLHKLPIVTFGNIQRQIGAICLSTGKNGEYALYIEFDDKDSPARIIIEFDAGAMRAAS